MGEFIVGASKRPLCEHPIASRWMAGVRGLSQLSVCCLATWRDRKNPLFLLQIGIRFTELLQACAALAQDLLGWMLRAAEVSPVGTQSPFPLGTRPPAGRAGGVHAPLETPQISYVHAYNFTRRHRVASSDTADPRRVRYVCVGLQGKARTMFFGG